MPKKPKPIKIKCFSCPASPDSKIEFAKAYIKENGEWKIQGTRVIYHFRSDMDTGWAK